MNENQVRRLPSEQPGHTSTAELEGNSQTTHNTEKCNKIITTHSITTTAAYSLL